MAKIKKVETTAKLDKFLASMDELEYWQVKHRIELADTLRHLEKQYKLSYARMAERLKLTVHMYKKWRNGAIDFDLKMLAKINVLSDDLYAENNDMVVIKMDEHKITGSKPKK